MWGRHNGIIIARKSGSLLADNKFTMHFLSHFVFSLLILHRAATRHKTQMIHIQSKSLSTSV
jgi:hypothetical protein